MTFPSAVFLAIFGVALLPRGLGTGDSCGEGEAAVAEGVAEDASLLQFRSRKEDVNLGTEPSSSDIPEAMLGWKPCVGKNKEVAKPCVTPSCPSEADWIIVGGGGAGCAAAAALADAGEDVLVLERGPSDKEIPSTQSADGWPQSVNDGGENIRWTEGVWGVVAKVLGGGTSLNGGLYFADTPEWFSAALPGVNQPKMYESYRKVAAELTWPSQPTDFGMAWNQALTDAGEGEADTTTAKLQWIADKPFLPYSTFNLSAPDKPRHGSAYLLHRRSQLSNLRVATYASVNKIIFEGKRAVAVDVSMGSCRNKKHPCGQLRAKKGVVISAGAIMTPKLLQISGVGSREVIEKLGVTMVSELPVGRNFTDRLVQTVASISPQNVDLTVGYTVLVKRGSSMVIEGVAGGKIASELGKTSLALIAPEHRTEALRTALTLAFNALPKSVLDAVNSMIQPVILQLDTHSRGSVEATSLDVEEWPKVTANYFKDPRDWASQVQRFSKLLELSKQPALENFTRQRMPIPESFYRIMMQVPGIGKAISCFARSGQDTVHTTLMLPCAPEPYDSEEARGKYIKDYLVSSYHYFGTAAAGDVVDESSFAVKGVEGLYVVDGSVIPYPTSVNPQGTIMALGNYVGNLLAEKRSGSRIKK